MFEKSTPLKELVYSTHNKKKAKYLKAKGFTPVIEKDDKGKQVFIYDKTKDFMKVVEQYQQ